MITKLPKPLCRSIHVLSPRADRISNSENSQKTAWVVPGLNTKKNAKTTQTDFKKCQTFGYDVVKLPNEKEQTKLNEPIDEHDVCKKRTKARKFKYSIQQKLL